jgi:pimeloyl-ACP methyl ester carboxylesterase
MPIREAEVSFRLKTSLQAFTKDVEAEFISDLARLSGCMPDEIRVLSLRAGCVVLNLKMPEASAKEMFKVYQEYLRTKKEREMCPPEVLAFLEKWKVEDFTKFEVDLDIVVKKKSLRHAILFVHGWRGDDGSFESFPDILFSLHKSACAVFPYPTGVLQHSPSIVYVADALHNWIKNRFKDHRIAILAHSQGGLVTRRFIVSATDKRDRLDMQVRNIVFFASPHNGTILANLGNKLPFLKSQQLSDLSDDSPILFDLNVRWKKWVKHYVPERCKLRSIFGTKDEVVTSINAIGDDEECIPILGRTHVDIVKPTNAEDEVVLTVETFLEETKFFELDEALVPAQ